MKFSIILLAFGLAVASAFESQLFNQDVLEAEWSKFKSEHGREYITKAEEQFRKAIFSVNLNFIYRHNQDASQGLKSYMVGVNAFADFTEKEFSELLNKKDMPFPYWAYGLTRNVYNNRTLTDLPPSVDWVDRGKVGPIKNQGQNGNAWAFSTIAATESAYAIKSNQLISLSEQEVSDCCNPYSVGIKHGESLYDTIFKCLKKEGGVDTERAYPDPSVPGQCKLNKRDDLISISKFVDIAEGDEACLQNAIANVGPAAVVIDASQMSFMFYTSGVYDEPACSSTNLDHGVAVVGYGTVSGLDFWKVRNSWGVDWGMDGYILMSRNKNNQCGIASIAGYPVVNNY